MPQLKELRDNVVKTYGDYLDERRKTFECGTDFEKARTQQYYEMQAEHKWLTAKQDYEIEMYNQSPWRDAVPAPFRSSGD